MFMNRNVAGREVDTYDLEGRDLLQKGTRAHPVEFSVDKSVGDQSSPFEY